MLIDLAIERGASLSEILSNTNIDAEQFKRRTMSVSLLQYARLVNNAVALFPHSNFALTLGQRININSRGQAGLFLMSQQSFGNIIRMGVQYQQLLQVPHHAVFSENQHECKITLVSSENEFYTPVFWQFVAEQMMASFKTTSDFILEKKLPLTAMHFQSAEPVYADAFAKQFNCPIYFNNNECAMIFPSECLDYRLATANEILANEGEEVCRDLLHDLQYKQSITSRIKSLLIQSENGFPDFPFTASALGLSERSLRRKLTRENTTYQQVLDEIRQEKAKILLLDQPHSVEYVARYLGFSNASNFRKAFKKWTGLTPQNFRTSQLHDDTLSV